MPTVTISAGHNWNPTKVTVAPGTNWRVKVLPGGRWTCNPKHGDYTGVGHRSEIAKPGYAYPGAPEGALVGKVNDDRFHIGDDGVIAIAQGKPPGELFLTCNDDLDQQYGQGYADNSGTLTVEITTT